MHRHSQLAEKLYMHYIIPICLKMLNIYQIFCVSPIFAEHQFLQISLSRRPTKSNVVKVNYLITYCIDTTNVYELLMPDTVSSTKSTKIDVHDYRSIHYIRCICPVIYLLHILLFECQVFNMVQNKYVSIYLLKFFDIIHLNIQKYLQSFGIMYK